MKGAEAVLKEATVLGVIALEKYRLAKKYRNPKLDSKIRAERTRREARLLERAKLAGVLCPVVFRVSDFSIWMKKLPGKVLHRELARRKITAAEISSAAKILVSLHSANVVHGDFTPANLMVTAEGMAVIDFGLGAVSDDVEDKATDIVMMKKALGGLGGSFVSAYGKHKGSAAVLRMVAEIEKRGRYMERG